MSRRPESGMFPADLLATMGQIVPLKRYFVSPDYDKALELLRRHLEFRVLEFDPRESVNKWMIPPGWELKEASIRLNGDLIYDATDHPLKIIALSAPFEGIVSRKELREHLHYDHRNPDWIPFHFRQLYRPWERTWGFCVPRKFYEGLEEGSYEVRIRCEEYDGPLKIAECTLPGSGTETIVLIAHLDHPGMANDDLAGVMAGVRVMQLLAEKPRRFTYRLVLLQEILGSVYYLDHLDKNDEGANIIAALFLEMLGSATPHALQRSYRGDTPMDQALVEAVEGARVPFRVGDFRQVICNDEAHWEAYGVPTPSLSRYPYPEYHSDKDDMSIISGESLEESARIVLDALERMEAHRWLQKTFQGAVCLSHPDYDLYVDPGQAAFSDRPAAEIVKVRELMDIIPIVLSRPTTERELAELVDLPLSRIRPYIDRWIDKGLIRVL